MTEIPAHRAGPRYRIEFHEGDHVMVVGFLPNGFAHHTTLDPYVGRLTEQGRSGWLVLITVAGDQAVARRQVRPSDRHRRRVRRPAPNPGAA